ncbi:hypothetical protein AB0K00_13415 [Dactylosporangium sp. NPDC049525]|uniref:hypothetical protein n=1 Tax=Dactylosporangium sp. NPDC049525 TaxID=3154730 RepID=UPI00342C76A4
MQRTHVRRAAGVVAAAVIAGVLAAPQPANADITVDSAVCLSNASGTLTSPDPVIPPGPKDFFSYPVLNWQATIHTTYCSQAGAALYLVRNGELSNRLSNPGSGRVFDPALYVLRVTTLVGSKDVASIRVIQG